VKKKPSHKPIKSPQKNKSKRIIKSRKCTAIEAAFRIEFIKKLRLAYFGLGDILKNTTVKKWKITPDGIIYYISQADKQIKEFKKSDMPKWIKECEQRLNDLYYFALRAGNLTECRKVLDTANKILGFEKLKVEIDKTETTTININIKKEVESSERIEEVIQKAFEDKLIPLELLETSRKQN